MFRDGFRFGTKNYGGAIVNPDAAIAVLFASGEQGGWYDPSDLSTMFQDTAGTIPVTAAGQLVARINDKSGNGNHLLQATSAQRPSYQLDGTRGYLLFDGTDDNMVSTGNFNLTANAVLTGFVGIRKNSDTNTGVICELSVNAGSNNGAFGINHSTIASDNPARRTYGGDARGSSSSAFFGVGLFTAPITNTLTYQFDLNAASNVTKAIIRVNTTPQTVTFSGTIGGSGNFGLYPLYVGRRAGTTFPLNGRIYSLILRGATTSGTALTDAEAWVNSKTGAY